MNARGCGSTQRQPLCVTQSCARVGQEEVRETAAVSAPSRATPLDLQRRPGHGTRACGRFCLELFRTKDCREIVVFAATGPPDRLLRAQRALEAEISAEQDA